MAKFYNIVLFTASLREYAEKILNIFDPKGDYIQNVLARENCTKHKNQFIKDFRIITNNVVKKENILMIDNKIISFAYNLFQGIPILPYYSDPQDTELRDIVPFLIHLSSFRVDIKEEIYRRYNYNEIRQLTFNEKR